MWKINGVKIKTPSNFGWGITDASSEESGRSSNDALMNKDVIAQKRNLELSWNNPTKEEVNTILTAVNYTTTGSFFQVTYPDALSGTDETRTFYVGDRKAPMKIWTIDKQIYSTLSFNIIEQ